MLKEYEEFTDKLLKEISNLRALNLKLTDENLRLKRANNYRMIDTFCMRNKSGKGIHKKFGFSIN